MIKFIKSKEIKVKVALYQQGQISSADKIKRACQYENIIAFDIYDELILVGFAMLRENETGKFFLWNYAIDETHQGKGYGYAALRQLILMLKEVYSASVVTTTYIFGNCVAKKLYEKIGFIEADVVNEPDCHEVNMILKI